MKHTLENAFLTLTVNHSGAEICNLISKETKQEYIWEGDANIWGGTAPVLFPIIGALKDNCYTYKGQTYSLPKHGFIRANNDLEVVEKSETKLSLRYKYNEQSLLMYPFEFEFIVTFSLEDNKVIVHHEVINHGTDEMLFSLGGHPAFACPIMEGGSLEDYYIEFNETENTETHLISEAGLANGKTAPSLSNTNKLTLTDNIFDADALIYKNLKSTSFTLKNTRNSRQLEVSTSDFDYLGIWSKPKAPYVCIEPWLGITDAEDTTGKFEDKEGVLKLDAKKSFEASYCFTITE